MKKITLIVAMLFVGFVTNAQEKEKKSESQSPAPSGGQSKSITENGISAPDKPKPKGKKNTSKSTQNPKKDENVTEEKKVEGKKPD